MSLKLNKKTRLIISLIALLLLAGVLLALYIARHIDVKGIVTIYVPLLLAGLIGMLAKQNAFSTLLFSSAAVGLVVKLLVTSHVGELAGSISNTLILLVGVVLGVMLQAAINRKRKAQKQAAREQPASGADNT